jgi:hypothetical protein
VRRCLRGRSVQGKVLREWGGEVMKEPLVDWPIPSCMLYLHGFSHGFSLFYPKTSSIHVDQDVGHPAVPLGGRKCRSFGGGTTLGTQGQPRPFAILWRGRATPYEHSSAWLSSFGWCAVWVVCGVCEWVRTSSLIVMMMRATCFFSQEFWGSKSVGEWGRGWCFLP